MDSGRGMDAKPRVQKRPNRTALMRTVSGSRLHRIDGGRWPVCAGMPFQATTEKRRENRACTPPLRTLAVHSQTCTHGAYLEAGGR